MGSTQAEEEVPYDVSSAPRNRKDLQDIGFFICSIVPGGVSVRLQDVVRDLSTFVNAFDKHYPSPAQYALRRTG